MKAYQVIIIGAGAAGLMCAIEAGKRGRSVLVLEQANRPGKKILMSGGGRCNFTNLDIKPSCFLSHNLHFAKSALSRYTQHDFIYLVKSYKIAYHEKTLGQLFCDDKAQQIVDMLLAECAKVGVVINLNSTITKVEKNPEGSFNIETQTAKFISEALVVASGGLSIPTMGSSPLGYQIAELFGLKVWPLRAGLVPLTLHEADKETLSPLSGVSSPCLAQTDKMSFKESLLFTHRGLSGPAILQISSYWEPGEVLKLNLAPDLDLFEHLKKAKAKYPQKQLKTLLIEHLPKRLVEAWVSVELGEQQVANVAHAALTQLAAKFQNWELKPNATEGYRTAEVTLGGVDCDALSSKTLEAKAIPGLYFIGEVVDVTGWLGGYNFQWAWSSGWAAGQVA